MSRLEYIYLIRTTIQKVMLSLIEDRDLFLAEYILRNGCYDTLAFLNYDVKKSVAISICNDNNVIYCPVDGYSVADYGYLYFPTSELFALCESLLKDNNGV